MAKLTVDPSVLSGWRSQTALFRWPVDYAHDVHDGKPGEPPRPWTKIGIERNDIVQQISSAFAGDRNLERAFTQTMTLLGSDFTQIIDDYDWGITGKGYKRYRGGRTLETISDSRRLATSLEVRFY